MNVYEINRWKESASESFAQNKESVKKGGCLYFGITTEQKEYLESHTGEIVEWCECTIDKTPVVIKFEPFWNGFENVFTCDCYFE